MTFLQTLLVGITILMLTLQTGFHSFSHVPIVSKTTNLSRNWSGYTTDHGVFSKVSAGWVVPQVSTKAFGADATWVGIGGVDSADLIQAGTQATVEPDGNVSYEAFYETLPDVSRALDLSIRPGDLVSASVSQISGKNWMIYIKNNTTGESAQFALVYDSSLSSAEWIEEAPSGIRRELPLDNFGHIKFSNATAIKNGKQISLALAHPQAITMGDEFGQQMATTSSVGQDGNSFQVDRTNVSDTPPIVYRFELGKHFSLHLLFCKYFSAFSQTCRIN